MIWAYLAHLSFNMWEEHDAPIQSHLSEEYRRHLAIRKARPVLSFDDAVWDAMLETFRNNGINMVVLDLGDGVQYASHPEIAVEGAWTPARLQRKVARLRAMGIEPIPKLNFSTCHDTWLGPYARCVSTDRYYAVCRDLIEEVMALFDRPRFFQLGMDEETIRHQQFYLYATVRQHDLWWHDLYFLQEQVEKAGARAWVWSDYIWAHPDDFLRKMPKSILQSNWYYGSPFHRKNVYVKAYLDLEEHGYDQIPTGSTWGCEENFGNTVRYCRRRVSDVHLLGFMQSPWLPTRPEHREALLHAAELVGAAQKRR